MRADSDLVERCLRGERGAWDELVLRYSRYVYAVVSQGYHLRGPDAEDAFQEVFLRIYERLGSLRDPAMFEQWLFALARNAALDFIRRIL